MCWYDFMILCFSDNVLTWLYDSVLVVMCWYGIMIVCVSDNVLRQLCHSMCY